MEEAAKPTEVLENNLLIGFVFKTSFLLQTIYNLSFFLNKSSSGCLVKYNFATPPLHMLRINIEMRPG